MKYAAMHSQTKNYYYPFSSHVIKSSNDKEVHDLPKVTFDQLNVMQKFCFRVVEDHIKKSEQLLLIINGTAGTGKSYLISAISRLAEMHIDAVHRRLKQHF